MENETDRERRRCVTICRRRAELWRPTLERSPVAGGLEEARARANEAAYLATSSKAGRILRRRQRQAAIGPTPDRFRACEEWMLGIEGRIAASKRRFDAADRRRQSKSGD